MNDVIWAGTLPIIGDVVLTFGWAVVLALASLSLMVGTNHRHTWDGHTEPVARWIAVSTLVGVVVWVVIMGVLIVTLWNRT